MARDRGGDGVEVDHTSAVFLRVGTIVVEVRLTRTNDPPPTQAARELAAAQAACLMTAACLRPLPAPGALRGGPAGDADTSRTDGDSLAWDPAVRGAIMARIAPAPAGSPAAARA